MAEYTIEGAQGFVATADNPETAYGKAEPASRQFSPITITGPHGVMSLADLKRKADEAKKGH